MGFYYNFNLNQILTIDIHLAFSLNYGLGSIAAGSVVGAWQRNHVLGWSAALFFRKCDTINILYTKALQQINVLMIFKALF